MQKTQILFENDEIIIINKQEGVSVQGGEGISHPLDMELSKELGYKIHLVHRLDKETSGLLIVAKNPKAASKWTNLIGTKEVKKEYLAVCTGYPEINGKKCKSGVLDSTVEAHGRTQTARTYFTVEKELSVEVPVAVDLSAVNSKTSDSDNIDVKSDNSEKVSLQAEKIPLYLVRLTLGTGRMHQIRIQMAQVKAPLAADDKHGNFKLNKKLRKAGIKKLQLVSSRLTIPVNGKTEVIECEMPSHMEWTQK